MLHYYHSDRDDAIERATPRRCARSQSKKASRRRQRLSTGRAVGGAKKNAFRLELICSAEKPVMLIDEPTTGLDASAARHVGRMVVSLSKKYARTVVCTLHQPAWSIVERFDRAVLLSRGRCCFAGPPGHLWDFQHWGLQCPRLRISRTTRCMYCRLSRRRGEMRRSITGGTEGSSHGATAYVYRKCPPSGRRSY